MKDGRLVIHDVRSRLEKAAKKEAIRTWNNSPLVCDMAAFVKSYTNNLVRFTEKEARRAEKRERRRALREAADALYTYSMKGVMPSDWHIGIIDARKFLLALSKPRSRRRQGTTAGSDLSPKAKER